jgi:hypothetical protein
VSWLFRSNMLASNMIRSILSYHLSGMLLWLWCFPDAMFAMDVSVPTLLSYSHSTHGVPSRSDILSHYRHRTMTDDVSTERIRHRHKYRNEGSTVSSSVRDNTREDVSSTLTPSTSDVYTLSSTDVTTQDIDQHLPSSDSESVTESFRESVTENCSFSVLGPISSGPPILYIGGLFELTGSRPPSIGHSELTAALLAVEHVNTQGVVPGYTLELLYNDTGVRGVAHVVSVSSM